MVITAAIETSFSAELAKRRQRQSGGDETAASNPIADRARGCGPSAECAFVATFRKRIRVPEHAAKNS
jgi:hypothetical protein